MSIRLPNHDNEIRVVYDGGTLPTHGRARRFGDDQLYFTPDGWTHGFVVEADELSYYPVRNQVMRPEEVAAAQTNAQCEYLRMFVA